MDKRYEDDGGDDDDDDDDSGYTEMQISYHG